MYSDTYRAFSRKAGFASWRTPALCRLKGVMHLRASHADRGFSMLELVITISIIVTIGMIAMPRFNETRARHRDENSARVIHRATEYAIAEARRRTATVTIRFNSGNELLSIIAEQSDGTSVELPWRGAVAGRQREGAAAPAWSIVVDPHGRVTLSDMPESSTLDAALSATGSVGSGIGRARP